MAMTVEEYIRRVMVLATRRNRDLAHKSRHDVGTPQAVFEEVFDILHRASQDDWNVMLPKSQDRWR